MWNHHHHPMKMKRMYLTITSFLHLLYSIHRDLIDDSDNMKEKNTRKEMRGKEAANKKMDAGVDTIKGVISLNKVLTLKILSLGGRKEKITTKS